MGCIIFSNINEATNNKMMLNCNIYRIRNFNRNDTENIFKITFKKLKNKIILIFKKLKF